MYIVHKHALVAEFFWLLACTDTKKPFEWSKRVILTTHIRLTRE